MENIVGSSTIETKREYVLYAWVVWGLAALFFFADYLARVAPTVMHQFIQQDFHLSEAGFSVLNASFYIPYILMQIPVGLAVDRLSIRGLLTVMSLTTALGCCVFGLSDAILPASCGRMLIGFSAAFAFVCALRLATHWFPAKILGLLAGCTQAVGMLGAAAGAAPVSYLVSMVGWRKSMLIIAFLFIVLAAFLYRFIIDRPPGKQTSEHKNALRQDSIGILQCLKVILTSSQTWINALYAGFLFGPTAIIGEFLGPVYLEHGRGLGEHAAAMATGLIFIGWGIGGPIAGWFSDKIGRRKPVMLFSAACGIVLSTVIVYAPSLSQYSAYLLLFVFGLTNIGVGISYAVATEIHTGKAVGTSIAFTNMISIFVGASLQPIVGQLLNFFGGDRAYDVRTLGLLDFQGALILLPISSLLAFILALLVKETHCRNIHASHGNI